MKKAHILALLALMLLGVALAVAGCGDKKEGKIIVYDGQFSEMHLVHRMVKLLVEEHTPAKVDLRDEMSHVNTFNMMIKGECDLYNSYDGTVIATFLRMDPKDKPEGMSMRDFANREAMAKHKLRLLEKLGTNNTYAIAVRQETAEQYGLENVSQLIPIAGELVFGGEHEFFSQEGSMRFNPFSAFYGLKFKDVKPIDMGLKYFAMESKNIDVTPAYATDGMNKKAQLKILKDDWGFFPEYNGAILVRDDLFTRLKDVAPNLEEVINRLGGIFTDEIMTDLTYACDVDERDPMDVAREFLQSRGLIKK